MLILSFGSIVYKQWRCIVFKNIIRVFGMKMISIALPILSIIMVVFSGCSTHEIEETSPAVKADHSVEAVPAIESTKEVKPVVIIEKKVDVKISKKLITKKELPRKLEMTNADFENLKKKVNENKTREVREILNENPQALEAIQSSNKKLLYIGPKGWRVIDIIEGLRNKKLKEKQVITHIKGANIPYKVFTYDEIQTLLEHKMPYKVINTMMNVSR